MEPFAPAGSRVLVTSIAAHAVRRGDLILHEGAGRLICHRVIRRRSRNARVVLLTRGDAWRHSGAWISDRQVLGRVIAVERNGRARSAGAALMRWTGLANAAVAEARRLARAALGRGRRVMAAWSP